MPRVYAPTPFRWTDGLDYPYGYFDVPDDSKARAMKAAGKAYDDPGSAAAASSVSGAGIPSRLARAIAAAQAGNAETLPPWCAPELWATGDTVYPGQFRRTAAGNLYQLHPSIPQTRINAASVAPSHVDNSGAADLANPTVGSCSATGSTLTVGAAPTGFSVEAGQAFQIVGTGGSAGRTFTAYILPFGTNGTTGTGGTGTYAMSSALPGGIDPISTANCIFGGVWFYRGQSTGSTSLLSKGLPPARYDQSPTGVISYIGDPNAAWASTGSTIVAGTGANGAAVGQGLLTIGTLTSGAVDIGSPVYGSGVTAGTQILSNVSGSGNGSTWVVNISQSVASTALSFAGLRTAGGLGLTQVIGPVSLARLPVTLWGGPVDNAQDPPGLLGPNSGTAAAPNYAASQMSPIVGFETNARWVAITPSGPIYAGDTNKYRIQINGRWVGINRHTFDFTKSGAAILIDLSKLQSGADAVSKVVLYGINVWYQTLAYTFSVGPNDYIAPIQDANGLRMSCEGDSLTAGGNGTPCDASNRWPVMLSGLLGVPNVYINAQGGTGLISDNGGIKTSYIQRIDRVNLFAPHIHIVGGSHNDVGNSGNFTSAKRLAAWAAYIAAFRAANPTALLIITGCKLLQGDTLTGTAGQIACEQDIASAVATVRAAGDTLTFFVPVLTDPNADATGGWYPGGAVVGRYFYNAGSLTDSHPLPAEHEMFAWRLAQAIRKIVASLNA